MLTLAGQVMSLTVRSTGQAKALTEVNQRFRILEQTLRVDLGAVHPGNSLILIQGNPANAYWTRDGKEADGDGNPSTGYPHPRDPQREDSAGNLAHPRADILMIFSARRARSAIHPDVTSELQQVVYGHVVLGEYVPDLEDPANPYEFAPGPEAFPRPPNDAPTIDPEAVSPVPAEQWHLGRRSVLLVQTLSPGGVDWWEDLVDRAGLDDDRILEGSEDVLGNFSYEDNVLRPSEAPNSETGGSPLFFPPIFDASGSHPERNYAIPFARSRLDPTPPALYADRLGHYFLPHCASFKVEWALDTHSEFVGGRLGGEKELYWFDPGHLQDPTDPDSAAPLKSLQDVQEAEYEANGESDRWRRLDALLTLPLAGRYDAESEEPEGRYSLSRRFTADIDSRPEWDEARELPYGDGRPNLAVFTASRPYPPEEGEDEGELATEEIFPAALRITVDMFDDEGRLERPMRHVMVIPVGQ
jgi:hypothetical protein